MSEGASPTTGSTAGPSTGSTTGRPLRRDARRNRDRILEAARDLFARRGLDVGMATVARHAGIGVATLYRRFPTKEALVRAVFTEQFAACGAVLDEAVADPDPGRGFRTLVERLCELQAADRGFSAALQAGFAEPEEVATERAHALGRFAGLVERAQAAGALRADFVPEDLILAMAANNGVIAAAPAADPAASRRLAGYLLSAFRPGDPETLPHPVRLAPHRVL
ncbi:TetR/AcrR family transcriptional regulator [Amycolatopsis jiangsuensis]|uniref:AcrR family transcriptional regulator n=1 Tax=Amycolatopsis jiangsuensis TaxID=1181879 RepID=A0A840IT71_9PSEU|nr:TetR/AcrR family transcriptional regulator [Amycolatopsis jiangsuensis]MBB4684174.1 AcrR family transcriptional regulator [Amycolatopsis jiangsuensis]